MFFTRLFSGIVLVILALVIVGKGGALLLAVSAAVSLVGMFELYRVMGIEKSAAGLTGYAAGVLYYTLLWMGDSNYVTLMAIAALMVLMAIYVFTFPKYKTEQVTTAFFGIFYLAVMLSYVYQVRAMTDGIYLTWLIIFSSWGCDTCAYCSGMLFGKHKLTPLLSPKKTVEGAVGGVAGAAALGALYALAYGSKMQEVMDPVATCAAACAIAAVISQVGDLAASAIKRNHGVKDYGHIIPGHGGVLDRFDSMIFTAPAIYFALTFLM